MPRLRVLLLMTPRLFAAILLLTLPSTALAAPLAGTAILIGKAWILMYVLVALCIGLGIVVIGRPSRRKIMKEPKD